MLAQLFRVLLALTLAAAAGVSAQDYPTRNIVLMIPFTAGGPTDTLGRNLAVALSATLKQQVIVENVAGAGGTIAYTKAAKSKPDGYTVLSRISACQPHRRCTASCLQPAHGLRVHRTGRRRADDS